MLTAGVAAICMFTNIHAAEVAGPPGPASLTVTPTPAATEKLKPTETPEPTAAPEAGEQNTAEQGTLSKPDHPDTVSADKPVSYTHLRAHETR